MKNAWREFKAFAMGGNMIDLAIGFIIGAAFAALVESFATNVLGDLIAAAVGKPNFDNMVIHVGKGDVHYGNFLTAILSFLILAGVLFGMVKLLKRAGMGNFRAQGQRECPYCREFVAVDAVKCKWCTSDIRAEIDGDEGAEERLHSH
jgi:large conductance mechanosensitive channel